MPERKLWSKAEDQLIVKSVQQNNGLKWKNILSWIKTVDSKFSRTSKQIRQRWKFHLDPNLTSEEWSFEEQQILFKSHIMKGSKWKEIQKLLPGRSQKSIKNYFYMTLRKSLRRVTKILGAKNSTDQNRELKPQVLTKLVESANERPQQRCTRLYNCRIHLPTFQIAQDKERRLQQKYYIQVGPSDVQRDDRRHAALQVLASQPSQLYSINKRQGLQAMEQKLSSLKIEHCLVESQAEKATNFGISTIPSLHSEEHLGIDEEFDDQQEKQPIIQSIVVDHSLQDELGSADPGNSEDRSIIFHNGFNINQQNMFQT